MTSLPLTSIWIEFNQQRVQLPEGSSLMFAIHNWMGGGGVGGVVQVSSAAAVNGDFVPKHLHSNYILQAGDVVLTFAPITGG